VKLIIRFAFCLLFVAHALAAPPLDDVIGLDSTPSTGRVCASCDPLKVSEDAVVSTIHNSGCERCHLGTKQALSSPVKPHHSPKLSSWRQAEGIQFSHRLHTQTIACTSCHSPEKDGTLATPFMEQCMDCHSRKKVSNRCDLCHQTRAGGALKIRFGSKNLFPSKRVLPDLFHHTEFKTNHGLQARTRTQACQSCHTPDECTTCHQLDTRIGVHQGDYIRYHSVDARHDPTSCSSCHQPATFCRDCHSRAGLNPAPGPKQFGRTNGRLSFHPPGFTGTPGRARGMQHHAFAAQKDLSSCATCHSPNDCVRCHSTRAPQSLRASPHPRRFRCGKALEVSANGCRTCHTDILSLRIRCQALGN